MSRDDGFPRADMDTAYLEDAKWRRAWRQLNDADLMAVATCLHLSTVLASWRHGERVVVQDAAPIWLPINVQVIAVLVDVGLLDEQGCVPAESWDAWYGPAAARKATASEAGREGNRRRWGKHQEPIPDPIATRSAPDPLPALPTNQPTRASDAREGLHNLNSTVAGIWEQATGTTLLAAGAWAAETIDDACRRHGPSETGAAILRARKTFDHIPEARALAAAVRNLLDPMPTKEALAPARSEGASRKRSESAKVARLVTNHSGGYHIDNPDPACPKCQEDAA